MQIVGIQRRPIIYSTCVQRLSLHTYTRVYTLLVLLDLDLMHPCCPSEWDTVQPFPPFCRKSLKKKKLYEDLSPLWLHFSILWRGWQEVRGEGARVDERFLKEAVWSSSLTRSLSELPLLLPRSSCSSKSSQPPARAAAR